ncbi:PREDICTED: uncharacterized protein LOC104788635 [Camelina sativa]|uniref:Uncharacterized protein LOC104788635 n=1 Tax=Camelina sativa TaxID=90675 RepID=A0ABM0ZAD9_CAMSA|nr:PREDICTED: uncharacterized protein LOC104788635 [Camelina sativa]
MLTMTSSSTILTGEDEEEDHRPPAHSHRRRWSTPDEQPDTQECREHNNNLDSYSSFYLGGKISSPWGTRGPPLLTDSSRWRGEERRGRSVTRKRDLPPYLTTLDCNGRPRYHHRRVRSEGRLEIASVAVDSPEIVSVRGIEGLRIGTVRISQQNHADDDDDDDDDDDKQQQNH